MDKIAVITGASRGIGFSLALELAKREITVIAISRNETQLDKLKSTSSKINTLCADINDPTDQQKIVDEFSKYPSIHYIVNNAGIITPTASISTLSNENIRRILETNLISPILLTNELIPHIKEEGRVLNITSVAANMPIPGLGSYCISKAGINMWTEILKCELKNRPIFATNVIPGEVDTDMQKDLREATVDNFPLAAEFNEAYKHKTLIPPAVCASFLTWLLLDTKNEDFIDKEWNIYDVWHHK